VRLASSGRRSEAMRLALCLIAVACARPVGLEGTTSRSELAAPEPFTGAEVAAALPAWSSWTVRETLGTGVVSLTRAVHYDVEESTPEGATWITRSMDADGHVRAVWRRHSGPWYLLQLGTLQPGDPTLERERATFTYADRTWKGWRYTWPDRNDPRVDERRLFFADARPGPPLRTEALREDEVVAFTELVDLDLPTVLPTPYTAEQIRDAMPAGTRLQMRLLTGTTTKNTLWEVTQADATAVSIRYTDLDADGLPTGTPTEDVAFWTDLRDHARFDHPGADRRRTTFTTALGTWHGWKYTTPVAPTGDLPGGVQIFLFADLLPGPPVSLSEVRGGRTVMQLEQRSRRPLP
jgi:hypothetical protein